MPFKKKASKAVRKFVKRHVKRTGFLNRYSDRNSRIVKFNTSPTAPLPDRVQTSFTMKMSAYIASGQTASAGVFDIAGNTVSQPFDGQINTINTQGQGSMTLSASSVISDTPTGVANLIGTNVYSYYRVLKSKLKMSLCSGSLADQVFLACAPRNLLVPDNYSTALELGYSPLGKLIKGSSQSGWVSKTTSATTAKVMGVTTENVMNDITYTAKIDDPAIAAWCWQVRWVKQAGAVAFASNQPFLFEITYDVILEVPPRGKLLEIPPT